MEPIEYVCDECGTSVMVRPYTEDEEKLVGDWTEDHHGGEGMCCGDCARKLAESIPE